MFHAADVKKVLFPLWSKGLKTVKLRKYMKIMIVIFVCKIINCPSEHSGGVAIDFRFQFLGVSGNTF